MVICSEDDFFFEHYEEIDPEEMQSLVWETERVTFEKVKEAAAQGKHIILDDMNYAWRKFKDYVGVGLDEGYTIVEVVPIFLLLDSGTPEMEAIVNKLAERNVHGTEAFSIMSVISTIQRSSATFPRLYFDGFSEAPFGKSRDGSTIVGIKDVCPWLMT